MKYIGILIGISREHVRNKGKMKNLPPPNQKLKRKKIKAF